MNRKKSKKDISKPKDFRHVEHVGPEQAMRLAEKEGSTYETALENGGTCSLSCQQYLQTSGFEDLLRSLIREELTTLKKNIESVEHKTGQLYLEIEKLREAIVTNALKEKTVSGYDEEIDNRTKSITDNAQLLTRYSAIFKSMPDLSSTSDEIGKESLSQAHRYRKTAEGTRLQNKPSIKKKIDASYHRLGIKRECMAQALQANIVHIVDGLEFNCSSLPDQLISAGHMTEEECDAIRTDKGRKDQIRYIVSRTKSRGLRDMEEFLDLISKQQNMKPVVNRIRDRFQSNLQRNDISTKCNLCLCYENIDVKPVVDILWSMGAVTDSFYRKAINCSQPRGCQERLWQNLMDICNAKPQPEKQNVCIKLFDYIQSIGRRGSFDFMVKDMKSMFATENKLTCHCHSIISLKTKLHESDSNDSTRTSSYSPRSSASDDRRSEILSGDFSKGTDKTDDKMPGKADDSTAQKHNNRPCSFDEDETENTIPKQKLYQTKSLNMLDTITEDVNISFKKDGPVLHQTLEFHHPLRVQVELERSASDRTFGSYHDGQYMRVITSGKNDLKSKRHGMKINSDELFS